MNKRKLFNGGYVGLLMLLFGVAVIAFLIVRTDLFSGQSDGKGMLQQGVDAVSEAEAVKAKLEQNNQLLPEFE